MSTMERAQALYMQGAKELESSNQEAAAKLLAEAATLGSRDAAFLLHIVFFMAEPYRSDAKHLARGMEYLKQAVDAGCPGALSRYSLYLANGMFDVPRDLPKSFELASTAAAQGDGMGHIILASFYCNGLAAERNAKKAVEHLEFALAAGELLAACHLGDIYARGFDAIAADKERALAYYYCAAEAGYAPAQAGYARLLLERAECSEKDAALCIDILENLAGEGNDQAMVALAVECIAGRHMEQNPERAEILCEQAAEMGNAEAQHMLEQLA